MRAVLITEPGNYGLEDLPDPTPDVGDVIVAPDGCGICGTDLHILAGEVPFTRYPIVPGHEFSGEVVAAGSGVDHVQVGDIVAVEPSLFCTHCPPCRTGRENLCLNFDSIGVGQQNGACAEFVKVPAHKAFALPEGMPRGLGTLVEPVSCVVHGFDMLDTRLGDNILIYGAGSIGLILAQIAAHHGAGSVSVVDTNPARLPRALEAGADHVAASADELGRPEGWEAVIDATGAVAAIEDAIVRASHGGTVLLFGVAPHDVQGASRRFGSTTRSYGSSGRWPSGTLSSAPCCPWRARGHRRRPPAHPPVQARRLRRGAGDLPPRERAEAHGRALTGTQRVLTCNSANES